MTNIDLSLALLYSLNLPFQISCLGMPLVGGELFSFLIGCEFDKLEVVSLYIRYFIILGMYFDGFAINNKYIPHISLTIASAMQITETGMSGKI